MITQTTKTKLTPAMQITEKVLICNNKVTRFMMHGMQITVYKKHANQIALTINWYGNKAAYEIPHTLRSVYLTLMSFYDFCRKMNEETEVNEVFPY